MSDDDYSMVAREDAVNYMQAYPDFGELRSYGDAANAEQLSFSWRLMAPGTGGRGSYGHRHKTQEEILFVASGTVTFKVGDDVFEAGPKTVVRIAPHAVRSIHNDTSEEAEVILCSVRLDDLMADVEKVEDFWPD